MSDLLHPPRPPAPVTGLPPLTREPAPSPGPAAAAIAVGVLCLWTPFTLIIAVLLATLPQCADAAAGQAAICTPNGHRAAMWSATTTALLGLLIVTTGAYVHPRRHHALFALTALATALAGVLITLALTNTAPAGWIPR